MLHTSIPYQYRLSLCHFATSLVEVVIGGEKSAICPVFLLLRDDDALLSTSLCFVLQVQSAAVGVAVAAAVEVILGLGAAESDSVLLSCSCPDVWGGCGEEWPEDDWEPIASLRICLITAVALYACWNHQKQRFTYMYNRRLHLNNCWRITRHPTKSSAGVDDVENIQKKICRYTQRHTYSNDDFHHWNKAKRQSCY